MKKIQTISTVFFLGFFVLTLFSPTAVFAAACPTATLPVGAPICSPEVTVDCSCGGVEAIAGDFCNATESALYGTLNGCLSGSGEIPPANFRMGTDSEVPTSGSALLGRIQLISNWVFAIFLAISLIFILLAAFQFVTGGGDPAKMSEARQKLIYAAMGIAIALISAGFPAVLRSIVT